MSARKRDTSVAVTGAAIFAVRDAWKLTQEAFGRVLGRTREWVARTESRQANMIQRGTLERIATAMGKTPDEALHVLRLIDFRQVEPAAAKLLPSVPIHPLKLSTQHSAPSTSSDDAGPIVRDHLVEIPLFDLSLAAGQWSDVAEMSGICGPHSLQQRLFRVRLAGDSMLPKYKNGSIVEFECVPHAEIGRDFYVQKDDGTATFKRVENATENLIYLRALNRKKYPKPLVVECSTVIRMAVAKGIFMPVD